MEKLFVLWVLCCAAYYVCTEIRDSGSSAMVLLAAFAGAAFGGAFNLRRCCCLACYCFFDKLTARVPSSTFVSRTFERV